MRKFYSGAHLCLILLAVGASGIFVASGGEKVPLVPPDEPNIAYGPHPRNVLDFWRTRKDKNPAPVVVFIHGGGFRSGDKSDYAEPKYLKPLLEKGVSCASINYRFVGEASLPDILHDCARAVQFIRSQAKAWNIDETRLAGWGGSAGAGTALWLGSRDDLADPKSTDPVLRNSSRLKAVVLFATQSTYDVTRWESIVGAPRPEWGLKPEDSLALYGFKAQSDLDSAAGKKILAECDMLQWIGHGDAPVFCVNVVPDGPPHDLSQWLHHPKHAEEIKKKCDAAGVACTIYKGPSTSAESSAIEFLAGHLLH